MAGERLGPGMIVVPRRPDVAVLGAVLGVSSAEEVRQNLMLPPPPADLWADVVNRGLLPAHVAVPG
ncbi:hypothetical protein ABT294_03930 [Nonomuraea sp. NPDC000554]|uniref:hypothetical protein n=1 Tax=Nonomuraea sp. NPDC000554 TaxID=3154259 RepID=UPI00331C15D9